LSAGATVLTLRPTIGAKFASMSQRLSTISQ
jgi:hypothetical protein